MKALRLSSLFGIAVMVGLVLVVSTSAQRSNDSNANLEGVWKIVEVSTGGTNPSANSSPQPGLFIFTKGHYSMVSVNGTQPRKKNEPLTDAVKATDTEKIARYDEYQAFTGQAGTYQIKGTTLTRKPLVAKNVGVMDGPPTVAEFKLDGNTLVIIGRPRGPGGFGPLYGQTTKFVRVE